MQALLQQPLLQFLLLGAVVFAVDHFVTSSRDDPRSIVIDDALYAQIAGIFEDNQGRAPSEAQMADLTVKWAQNEVLYREARLMGLDKGDDMIRERLILKLRNVLFNRVVTEPPTEAELAAFFAANRQRYERQAAYDFEQFAVAGGSVEASALAASLGATAPQGEWRDKVRRYAKRPERTLYATFAAGAKELIAADDARWRVVESPAGWHLARVTGRYPAEQVALADVRTRVVEDWKAAAVQADLGSALQAIAGRYDIRIELSTPPADWDDQRIEQVVASLEAP